MEAPVLVGVDGSPGSAGAAHWAAAEAWRRGAPLRLVHAWPWLTDGSSAFVGTDEIPAAAQRMLAGTAEEVRKLHPDLAVHTDVVLDAAVDGLVAAAEEAQLVVLGSRGLGGFAGLLVGSVGLATAARANAPVVLVRPPAPGQEPPAAEVVVGVDARTPDDEVLEFAHREARLRGARLRVVHGWELPPVFSYAGWVPPQVPHDRLQALETELLDLALAGWRERHPSAADTEVVPEVGLGAARRLVAASTTAELVVIGRRRRPHDFGARLGRVAHAVLHHAHGPVAVVPHD